MSHTFAISLHPGLAATSRPLHEIAFFGKSLPHYQGIWESMAPLAAAHPRLAPAMADMGLYHAVHTQQYMAALAQLAAGQRPEPPPRLSAECAGLAFALPAYQYALGGMCAAIDQMRAGALDRAYCCGLGGHHAAAASGHGYCLLNPLAAATRYAQGLGFRHVLLIDWDIHHGDGTQAIFAGDPTVYHISIHSAFDLYMATQGGLQAATTAAAAAAGHCNIPVRDDRMPSDIAERLGLPGQLFSGQQSIPALAQALEALPWQPDLIGIFSGYDAHRDDCGAHITGWQNEDFRTLTRLALGAARRAGCPLLSVHGGGYAPSVTVAAALSHIATLAEG